MLKKLLYLAFITLVLSSCSQNKIAKNQSVEQKMQIANDYFNNGKYRKAIAYYEDITYERNSPLVSEAQMKLAESYFNQAKYLEARLEFQEIIRLYRNYDRINEAYYKIGICYFESSLNADYTQEETELSIDAFNTFLQKFPFDDYRSSAYEYLEKCNYKLLKKKYHNGYAYYKMSDYSAALYYFDEIIETNLKDEIDLNSLYFSAKIYLFRKDNLNAEIVYSKMQRKYPNDKKTIKIGSAIEK